MARPALLALALALPLVLAAAPATTQPSAEDGPTTRLFAHWPDDVQPGSGAPVPMTLEQPTDAPDVDAGPLAPRTTQGGALPAFTYLYQSEDGETGLPGSLTLTGNDTATLFVFLSPDERRESVPNVTVEAQLLIGQDVVGIGQTQATLVSVEAVNDTVQRVDVPLELNATQASAGDELRVDFWIFRANGDGGVQDVDGWTFHTGEAFPTGLELPVPRDQLTAGDGGEGPLEGTEDTPGPGSALAAVVVGAVAALGWRRR